MTTTNTIRSEKPANRIRILEIDSSSPRLLASTRRLFIEYAESLHFNLCFQNFNDELANLPVAYSPPTGRLMVAKVERSIAGCVALHALSPTICEMKRLYVRPNFRGIGLGRVLAEKVVDAARDIGYASMRLDTIDTMVSAIELYRSMGFTEIPAYRPNPIIGALYMELQL